MRDSVTTANGQLTISIADKLTFEDHNDFRELLKLMTGYEHRSCVIDLHGLQTIDSAGLGMLMIAYETAEKAGMSFMLSKPVGQVERLLEISEFDKVMRITH
ncbi:MAG: STAS domain-containing protein [Sneathiella sp.]|nr:STAS domain-containing protein [Sneathiella sp.]